MTPNNIYCDIIVLYKLLSGTGVWLVHDAELSTTISLWASHPFLLTPLGPKVKSNHVKYPSLVQTKWSKPKLTFCIQYNLKCYITNDVKHVWTYLTSTTFFRKKERKCKTLEKYIKSVNCVCMVVFKGCFCTLSPSLKCRDAEWQLGTGPTHWTTKWEKWPAFTSSFKNSFTSCQIPLWLWTCTGAAGQDWAWPSSYRPDPAHRSSGQLILPCQGFLAPLLIFFHPNFPHYLWCALGRNVVIRVPENPFFF